MFPKDHIYKLTCLCCGKQFDSQTPRALFCSDCRDRAHVVVRKYRKYCAAYRKIPEPTKIFQEVFPIYKEELFTMSGEGICDVVTKYAEKHKSRPNDELKRICIEAESEGLSYGQYVALYLNK